MRLRTFVMLVVVTLAASPPFGYSAATPHHEIFRPEASPRNSDPISGEWDVSFTLQGRTVPGKFKLKLDGDKVTGTAESEHTGPGIVSKGSWVDNKLAFTLDFKKHDSIDVIGSLKDGKLVGEFRTEGMQGTWEAIKK